MRVFSVSLCVFCLMAFISGCDQPAAKKAMTTAEFEKLVKNKVGQEVLKAVGKPQNTQKSGGVEYWYYDNVATNPITGKPASAQLVFGGDSSGWCQTVNWH